MADYYVATAANNGDNAHDGSSGSPWLTVTYACSQVAAGTHTIHIGAGTFNETTQSLLAVGVSIEGAGDTATIINSTVAGTSYTIRAYSSSVTAGNQHISGIRMTGSDYTAYGAIQIYQRSNVYVYDCDFVNFGAYGVQFFVWHADSYTPPATYATGNKFYNNTMSNCGRYYVGPPGDAKSAMHMEGQDGLLIYNNTIIIDYADHENGNCIGAVAGYNKNVKIHDNTLDKTFVAGTTNWDFAIEMWSCKGGVEIYDNIIYGAIDIGGRINEKGASTYSVWVHNNRIGIKTPSVNESTRGIVIEGTCEDVLIERNWIENVSNGIYTSQVQTSLNVENIIIRYNVFHNIGLAAGGASSKGWGIRWTLDETYHNHTVNNYQVYNNVFSGTVAAGAPSTAHGIMMPGIGTATNIYYRNNIIQNFDMSPIYCAIDSPDDETIDGVWIQNNIYYANGHSNTEWYNGYTPDNITDENNQVGAPGVTSTSDYHLTEGSIAINNGLYITSGLTDLDEVAVSNPPEVGAYEYGVAESSDTISVPDTTTFSLQDVVDAVNPTTDDLADCFSDATAGLFDASYEGSKNSLLNFRNYGG